MERLKVILSALTVICFTMMLGGCAMGGIGNYYENEEEAKEVLLQLLEEKYQKKFTLTGESRYWYSEGQECYGYKAKFQDEDGIEADAILPQIKSEIKRTIKAGIEMDYIPMDDTYSDVFYTKKAINAIEPLFEGEPFEWHVVQLNNPGHAGKDLSLTLEEFFKGSEVMYWINIYLPDGQDRETYAQTLYQFYKKITTEQSLAFSLTAYSNDVEFFSVYYVDAEGFYPAETLEDISERMTMSSKQPLPVEFTFEWDYCIKEMNYWIELY